MILVLMAKAGCTIGSKFAAISLLASFTATAEPLDTASGSEQQMRLGYGFGVYLAGTPSEVMRFKHWLDVISGVPKGIDTLWTISRSGHNLEVVHSRYSVISSGRTQAPMTQNLTNGVGEDVTILFNAYIPEEGSHQVFDTHRKAIEFTAVQNLYHELAHAMHKMTGRWPYFRSEWAAIEEENVFRREMAEIRNVPYAERFRVDGAAICPTARMQRPAWSGQELICGFN